MNIPYCDSEEVVKKLKAIIRNKRTYLHRYHISEHETVLALIPILPKQLQDCYIKNHQDKVKGKENLILPEQLNSIANELVDTYTTIPKQINLPSTPVAVYFKGQYIANDYQQKIRSINNFK